ncbi:MAG: Holliday junction resolvase RuvX [Chloroflexi bacterium]|nr:Holliday junction resolvase RuvX [Chloroflexota bacterium]
MKAVKYLALDLGNRRIGLALGGEIGVPVVPVGYLVRKTLRQDIDKVLQAASERDVDGIVAGMPYSLSGEVGEQARLAEGFVRALMKQTKLPVHTVDERFTSVRAEEMLRESGRRPSEDRGEVDASAAVLILERFLSQGEDQR